MTEKAKSVRVDVKDRKKAQGTLESKYVEIVAVERHAGVERIKVDTRL